MRFLQSKSRKILAESGWLLVCQAGGILSRGAGQKPMGRRSQAPWVQNS